ncbi:hypothetical protein GCM10010413_24760 [Promicromonospora sukumoe]|uniref:Uncharacterized protein n=1 Tax=Promicromonospora sukumoe TaxID=88382 RepID=A0A7W3J8N8_9MICO|nr:hypothetical protein [Promicromonospora sukumoe]MBA8808307.1 hypothetical protein [Promicromonospora sukumoe]
MSDTRTISALRIDQVIEVLGEDAFDLWPVVGQGGHWYLALHGELSDAEVGTAVHQILRWFHTDENGDEAPSLDVYLGQALGPHDPDGTQPMAMGGPRFTDTSTGDVVIPGCCNSLDERFEILEVLDGGRTECWLGHSPVAAVTLRHGLVEIIQDAEEPASAVLRFSPEEMRGALARAEADLDGFRERVAVWARTHAPEHSGALFDAVAGALVAGPR